MTRPIPKTIRIVATAAGSLLAVLILYAGTLAADYYVSPQGGDDQPGTADRPLKTLSAAARKVNPGDRVLIGAGVYAETLEITRSGTAAAPITFQPQDQAAVTIDAAGLRQGVIIWNADYIVVRGLTIENSQRSGIHLHDHQDGGYGADFNRIEGNTIRQCGREGYNGIYVGGNGNQVSGNQVTGSGRFDPAAYSGHGIYVLGSRNTVSGNTVQGSARAGIRLEGEDNVFENNILQGNLDFGLTIWVDAPFKGRNIRISGNTLRDNGRGGMSLYGQGDGEKPENITITGNTFDGQQAEFAIRVLSGCRAVRIYDNVFRGAYRTAVLYVDAASIAGYEEHHNQFEVTGPFYFRDTLYATYADYKKVHPSNPGNLRQVP